MSCLNTKFRQERAVDRVKARHGATITAWHGQQSTDQIHTLVPRNKSFAANSKVNVLARLTLHSIACVKLANKTNVDDKKEREREPQHTCTAAQHGQTTEGYGKRMAVRN